MAALFGKKKKDEKEVQPRRRQEASRSPEPKASGEKATATHGTTDLSWVLRNPRITEKAALQTGDNVYVFDVAPDANKVQVSAAVKHLYNVTPAKVRVARIPRKTVRSMRTGIAGTTTAGKKAYVYLQKGESISIT